MPASEPVLVVGAGIAGLSAALALARRGTAVRLLERAEALEAVGAGVQLSPNALRVLAGLGVLEPLRLHAFEADHVELRELSSGRRLARVAVRGSDGTPYWSVHRADLQSVLLAAVRDQALVDMQLGTRVAALRRDDERNIATTLDHAGRETVVAASAIIAADGVASTVAAALAHPPARSSGDVAYRLTLPADGSVLPSIIAWLSPDCHMVAYPIRHGACVNVVLVVAKNAPRSFLQRLIASASDPLLERIAATIHEATVWPLSASERKRRPSDPSDLVFIGDAAHAMLPYAAQGAALALEDGFVAAHDLAHSPDPATAWRTFEARRRPRWAAVRRRVAFHRFVYHMPYPLTAGRDFVLARSSAASLGRSLRWLYDWHPPA